MEFTLHFKVNEFTYVRDPESTELGKHIVKSSIDLIYTIGFENFTFKKLATHIKTTEASIYRYFENKHKLLLYITSWYWSYLIYWSEVHIATIENPNKKIEAVIKMLTSDLPESASQLDYNKKYLNEIVIAESSKVYLIKEVKEYNENLVFQPYKDFCAILAKIISSINKQYKYPNSLSSTIIEASHQQQFFAKHLPRLTNVNEKNKTNYTYNFLLQLVQKSLL